MARLRIEASSLSDEDNSILNDMTARLREAHGELLQNQRLSLTPHRKPEVAGNMALIMVEHLGRLSPEGREVMLRAYREILSRQKEEQESDVDDGGLEALGARYARELIDLLPTVVAKASSLQELEIARIPKPSVQRYFDEAHRCYFFGLNKACVALCRAILEAALKEVLGSNHRPNELLDLAHQRRVLDDERLDAAERIFSAGRSFS